MEYVKKSRSLLKYALINVAVVIALKLVAHWLDWEIISLNPLFSGIVAANVFLMGFLLSGVIADYKESERLPGELAASLETIAEEAASIFAQKNAAPAQDFLTYMVAFSEDVREWMHKIKKTRYVMDELGRMPYFFRDLETLTQANFIARLKQEQANIRRILIRIHTIRETSFISSGYVIADATTYLLIIGLVLSKIEPFVESLFFVSVITFLMRYLGLLIRDLDNPFGHYEANSVEDVSLKPVDDAICRIKTLASSKNGQN